MAQNCLDAARYYEEQEQFQEALAEYGRAVQESPDDALPLLCRGALLAELGQYEAGIADFSAA